VSEQSGFGRSGKIILAVVMKLGGHDSSTRIQILVRVSRNFVRFANIPGPCRLEVCVKEVA
jgi:hypothetical protein